MQEETTPIFKRLWYDWTQQQPGIEPTNPLGQCWVPPIVAFYDQQGLLRTYSLPGSSIRSPHPGSPQGRRQEETGGDRRRQEETGGDRRRQEETGGDRKRQEETEGESDESTGEGYSQRSHIWCLQVLSFFVHDEQTPPTLEEVVTERSTVRRADESITPPSGSLVGHLGWPAS